MNDSPLPATRQDTSPAPLNLANAFDLALPIADRSEFLMNILSLAAELTIQRDEENNAEAYADPEFRQQEVRRRTLRGIEDLRQAANMLELRWAMDNGHETWIDADGAEVSLLDVIEGQMPDEEQRKSSGRSRELWMFVAGENSAVAAFREQGIPDQEIASVGTSGLSSVYGIVASTRKKLEEAYPEEELRPLYEELIEAAAETTNLDALRKKCRQMVDPTDTPPPPIRYCIENDGISEGTFYFLARPTQDQIRDVFLKRLGDVLEVDKLLPEAFVRYWRSFASVSVGQG
jgi:hypothetical protein